MMLNRSKEPSGPPPSWSTKNASPQSTTLNAVKTKEPAGPPPAFLSSARLAQDSTSMHVMIPQPSKTSSLEMFGESSLTFGVQKDQNNWNQTVIRNDQSGLLNNNQPNPSSVEGGMLSTLTRKRRRDSENEQEMFTNNENATMNHEGESNEDDDDNIEDEQEEEEQQFVYQPPQFASLVETDPKRLAQRQKQIDMGKNTIGYQNYTENVPRLMRQKFNKIHPVTPDVKELCSKRCFDGKIKAWRRQLHYWDILPGQSAANRVHVPNTMMRKRIRVEQQQVDMAMVDDLNAFSSSQKSTTQSDEKSEERSMFVDDLEL